MCWLLHSHDGWFIRLLQHTLEKSIENNPQIPFAFSEGSDRSQFFGFWFIVTSDSLCLWSLCPCAWSCADWECYHPLIPKSWTPKLDPFSSATELCFVAHFILNQPVHFKWLRQQVTASLSDFKGVRKWGGGGDTEHLEMETLPADLSAAKSWSMTMTIRCRGVSDIPTSYPSPVI